MDWQPIETAPDEVVHIRGLWVYRASTFERLYWQADIGFVNDDGEFVGVGHTGDFGWRADDYTHWMPLPEPPEQNGTKT